MRKFLTLIGVSAGLLSQTAAFAARGPVAVVESIEGKVAGVEFMDYVTPGQMIKLGPKDSIVLSYMQSCVREKITGGTVIVVEYESMVQFGTVERSRVPCDTKMQLASGQGIESAGTIFRGGPGATPDGKAAPLTLHGLSPMVKVDDRRSPLTIERLDAGAQRLELAVAGDALVRGKFFDLAKAGISLTPGASYALSQGTAKVEFNIAADAKPGASPIIGRLLQLD